MRPLSRALQVPWCRTCAGAGAGALREPALSCSEKQKARQRENRALRLDRLRARDKRSQAWTHAQPGMNARVKPRRCRRWAGCLSFAADFLRCRGKGALMRPIRSCCWITTEPGARTMQTIRHAARRSVSPALASSGSGVVSPPGERFLMSMSLVVRDGAARWRRGRHARRRHHRSGRCDRRCQQRESRIRTDRDACHSQPQRGSRGVLGRSRHSLAVSAIWSILARKSPNCAGPSGTMNRNAVPRALEATSMRPP